MYKKILGILFIVAIGVYLYGVNKYSETESNLDIKEVFMSLDISYDFAGGELLSKEDKDMLLIDRSIVKNNADIKYDIDLENITDSSIEIISRASNGIGEVNKIKMFDSEGSKNIIAHEINYSKINKINFYLKEAAEKEFDILSENSINQILPKVTINDFLEEEYSNEVFENVTINYYFTEDYLIDVHPNIWMDERFENIDFKYDIKMKWNKDKFDIIKSTRYHKKHKIGYKAYTLNVCALSFVLIVESVLILLFKKSKDVII
ncbi:MAG: hypothetical protein N4A47_01020 [Clostridia bacterium]|jgi:hypothetical protein|nr:hypothetical protein [Clostridia bacterium]